MRIFELKNKKPATSIAKEFTLWACKKLGIDKAPKIKFSNDKEQVRSKRTFGTTEPNGEIWVYVGDRNTADMLRTLCHELVHFKQFELGSAGIDMDKKQHQKIEDEANAIAGRLMREYGIHNVEIYETKTSPITHEVADSFDPGIDKIIDAALKDIGANSDKIRIGVKGSKESINLGKKSPVQSFKG